MATKNVAWVGIVMFVLLLLTHYWLFSSICGAS